MIATEYFKKWVEIVPFTYVTGTQILKFIINHLIFYYGIPLAIIVYNGKSLKNKNVKVLCQNFQIQLKWSTRYYRQGNGKAKTPNKIFIQIMEKMVNKTGHNLNLQIHPTLWEYQTYIHTPTGVNPYSFFFHHSIHPTP